MATETYGWHTPELYIAAVVRAGGAPVLLPGYSHDGIDAWLEAVDGVVLIGGGDINPAHYGGDAQHPTLYGMSEARDATELALCRALLQHKVPTLAICRGLQVINTVLGGSLHVHLPDVVGEQVLHRSPERTPIPHGVEIDAGSRLAGLLGTQVTTASFHHQAIDRLGQGMKAVAWAPDGVIEAVELADQEQLVMVQWHPEITATEDGTQQGLFNWLVQAARQ
ncbi:putative glutamine amidotransferase [Neisseria sp. HSC-16F19]|nr:putative glutamine amidotransferase [Neisseria sp. HSC-16F19]